MARLVRILDQLENFLFPDHTIVHLIHKLDNQIVLLDTCFTRHRQACLTSLKAQLRIKLRQYTDYPLNPTELEVAYQFVSEGVCRAEYLEATDHEAFYSSY